jgi:hypothetical protein
MKKDLTVWQRMAVAHPHNVDVTDEPDPLCIHVGPKDRTVILSCDIDAENCSHIRRTRVAPLGLAAQTDSRRSRAFQHRRGRVVRGGRSTSQILHLRRRMTIEEIKLLGSSGEKLVSVFLGRTCFCGIVGTPVVRSVFRQKHSQLHVALSVCKKCMNLPGSLALKLFTEKFESDPLALSKIRIRRPSLWVDNQAQPSREARAS